MKKELLEQIIREELHNIQEQLGTVTPVKPTPVKPTVTVKDLKPKPTTTVKPKKVVLPPTGTIFHTGQQVTDFRNWMKQKHQTEWSSKLKSLPANEPQTADVEMYVKYKKEYAAYLKQYKQTLPDDESVKKAEETDEKGGSWLTHGITAVAAAAIIGGVTGLSIFGVIKFFINQVKKRRARQTAQANAGGGKGGTSTTATTDKEGYNRFDRMLGYGSKSISSFMNQNAWKMAESMAKNPKLLKAEIDKITKYTDKQIRAEIIAVTDHIPTQKEINEFRAILNNPQFTTQLIINTRRNIFKAFLDNTPGITATKVIDMMTAKERTKYASYIRKLEAQRNRTASRTTRP
jgi:hypothetical protein